MLVALRQAASPAVFGGKAAQLAHALAAGLPVPDGFALSVEAVDAISAGAPLGGLPEGRWAVRSSAIGEDSREASFAGQHLTRLNVPTQGVEVAVREVRASAHAPSALAYRARLGIKGPARMAVVLQRMVRPVVAGVLFTKNPVTGAEELVIEGSWGLGEAVVAGLVTPDSYRLSSAGELLEARAGHKEIEIRHAADGGTVESAVEPARVRALCLPPARLARLHGLAQAVLRLAGGDQDLEWAFDDEDALVLLQQRGITT